MTIALTSSQAEHEEFSAESLKVQIDRISRSRTFENSQTLQRLLRYLAAKSNETPGEQIKEYTIGVEALERRPSFDPKEDTIVRVQIHRLREKLLEYYEGEGLRDPKVAAKPELVQISTAYKQQSNGEKAIPRNKYVEIREEKPDTPEKAKRPEFKTRKYTTEAIVADGIDKGKLRKVCTEPTCPVHHPKKQTTKADVSFKAKQEKRRREEALANATGIRALQAIVSGVPVRLMNRDILFIGEQLLRLLDEKRVEMVARHRGIKAKEGESAAKLLTAFVRRANESTIGKMIVETVILLSARTQADGGKTLRAAARYTASIRMLWPSK
jgi:hypothetical protein